MNPFPVLTQVGSRGLDTVRGLDTEAIRFQAVVNLIGQYD